MAFTIFLSRCKVALNHTGDCACWCKRLSLDAPLQLHVTYIAGEPHIAGAAGSTIVQGRVVGAGAVQSAPVVAVLYRDDHVGDQEYLFR